MGSDIDCYTPSLKPITGKGSPKINVCKQREKFKPKNKCKNVKDFTEECSRDFQKSKPPPAIPKKEQKDPFKAFMEEMRGEFRSLKEKFDTNESKIDKINEKIENVEKQRVKTELENKREISLLRQEIVNNKAN